MNQDNQSVVNSSQVVDTYNILYKLDNRYNKYANEESSFTNEDNTFGYDADVPVAKATESQLLTSGNSFVSQVGSLAGESVLKEDDIKRAVIQFFDNGEKIKQRYKLKTRLNLVDGTNPEFIATLTSDWSNFTKYVPEECREYIIEQARATRAYIKETYGWNPLLGKFHLNQGRKSGMAKTWTQVEPNTLAFVWYNKSQEKWQYSLQIYDWTRCEYDLTMAYLTNKQTGIGIKGQDLFINPTHDTRQRPKTWAQLRAEK
jgi:hypothetical protein